MKRLIHIAKRVAAIVIAVYAVLLGALYFEQDAMLYHRTTERPMLNDAALEQKRVLVCLETADGIALRSWYFPPQSAAMPVVLFLHGNAGDIGDHLSVVRPLIDAGYGVLALEYRGYGGNAGKPSEAGLYDDARAAFAFLEQQSVPDDRVILFGESLGTGVAVQMATEHRVAAIVLRSPYTSMPDLAALHFPLFLGRWLVRDRFDSFAKIARIGSPLLIYHGEEDALIPIADGRRLYDAAPEPKVWLAVPGVGHNDIQIPAVDAAVQRFLAEHLTVTGSATVPPPAVTSMAACGS